MATFRQDARATATRRGRLAGPVAAGVAAAWVLAAGVLLPARAETPPSSPSQAAAPQAQLVSLMAQLAQRKHGHVAYVEEHFISTLERPLKSSGELLYDAPGRLEKRTLVPKPESVVLENDTMTARRGRHTYVVSLQDHPQVVPLIESIRAMMAGDLPTLEHLFTLDWEGGDPWRLQMTPREAGMGQTVKAIEVRGSGVQVKTVEIRQPDGDRSLMTIGAEIAE